MSAALLSNEAASDQMLILAGKLLRLLVCCLFLSPTEVLLDTSQLPTGERSMKPLLFVVLPGYAECYPATSQRCDHMTKEDVIFLPWLLLKPGGTALGE